jgi:hypothetical protein
MDYIKTTCCDGCSRKAPCVRLHSNGQEVLALCDRCAPRNFEHTVRKEVDEWLEGGSPMRFGQPRD